MGERVASAAALVLALLAAQGANADEAAVDAEFLEFLGSLDSEDGAWTEFLAATDVKKVTAKQAPAGAKPAKRVESDDDAS